MNTHIDTLRTFIEETGQDKGSVSGQMALLALQTLEAELDTDSRIMEEQDRIMDAIPPCPAHGHRCIPHAVEWIARVRTLSELIVGKKI